VVLTTNTQNHFEKNAFILQLLLVLMLLTPLANGESGVLWRECQVKKGLHSSLSHLSISISLIYSTFPPSLFRIICYPVLLVLSVGSFPSFLFCSYLPLPAVKRTHEIKLASLTDQAYICNVM